MKKIENILALKKSYILLAILALILVFIIPKISLFTFLTVIFVYYFYKSDKFSLIVFILALPTERLSSEVLGVMVSPALIILILTGFKILFRYGLFSIKNYTKTSLINVKNEIIDDNFSFILMLLFIISIIISTIFAIDKVASLMRVFQFICLFLTAYSFYWYSKLFDLNKILSYFIYTSIPQIILGYLQIICYYFDVDINNLLFPYFMNSSSIGYHSVWELELSGAVLPRMNGFVLDPSIFAGYLTIILILILTNNIEKFKPLKAVISFIVIMAIVLTFSRSAWLGTCVGLLGFIVCINTLKLPVRKYVNLFVLFAGALSMILFSDLFIAIFERIAQMFDGSHVSTEGHRNLALYAIHAFIERPLFGIGLNNFSVFVGHTSMTHSMYLTMLAETGIIGSLLIFSLFIILLLVLFKMIKDNIRFQQAIALFLILISILFSNIGYDYHNQFFIWAFVGLAISFSKDQLSLVNAEKVINRVKRLK